MCKTGVTNGEPSEDNGILVVKVVQITMTERGLDWLDRMQFFDVRTSIPLSLPESLTMDSQILI